MTLSRHNPEGIYRRVSVRLYADAKFARLSPLQPSGQALWLYLLTGPHTGQIPGVFVAGRAALAEALNWDIEDFDAALAEIVGQGMVEFDAKARLWFVPRAIDHNPPASPNVVLSWRSSWALLPECALRDRIAGEIDSILSEPFAAAFAEVCGKPSAKASVKASAKALPNQEQELEQESDGAEAPSTSSQTTSATTPIVPCPYDAIVDAYHEELSNLPEVRLRDGKTWVARQKAMRAFWRWVLLSHKSDGAKRCPSGSGEEAMKWIRDYFARARDNDFLMGRTARGAGHENWIATFDFLLSEKGKQQVIEKTKAAA